MEKGADRRMIKKIFDMDNPLMQGLSTAAYLMILNLLAMVCCLPVFTAGASLTALHDVIRDMVRHEETYPAKMFFDSFKKNLRAGSRMGLIFIAAAVLILANYYAAAAFLPAFRFISLALGIVLLAVSFWAFALLARFENTVRGTLRNAILLTAGYFPRTAGMTAFTVIFYLAALKYTAVIAPVAIMFGFSLPVYVCTILLNGILEKMEAGN